MRPLQEMEVLGMTDGVMMSVKRGLRLGVALSVAAGALWFSCGRESVGPSGAEIADFPNYVGSYWKYVRYDSLSWPDTVRIDTVLVSIVDTTVLSNDETASVWVYEFEDRPDTQYVSIVNDTVRVYRNAEPSYLDYIYIFPLEVGKSWGTTVWDSSRVVDEEEITVPFGTFQKSFRVDRLATGTVDYYLSTSAWIVNKVGMVQLNRFIYGIGPLAHDRWELLNYEINP